MKKIRRMKGDSFVIACIACVGIASIAAWLTHVITCFSDDRWGFLIAGALFFPVAVVHGVGIWLGSW